MVTLQVNKFYQLDSFSASQVVSFNHLRLKMRENGLHQDLSVSVSQMAQAQADNLRTGHNYN